MGGGLGKGEQKGEGGGTGNEEGEVGVALFAVIGGGGGTLEGVGEGRREKWIRKRK